MADEQTEVGFCQSVAAFTVVGLVVGLAVGLWMAGRLSGGPPETLLGMMIFYVVRGAVGGCVGGTAVGIVIGATWVWLLRRQPRDRYQDRMLPGANEEDQHVHSQDAG